MDQVLTIFQQEKNTIDFINRNGLSILWRNNLNNSWWISKNAARLCGYDEEVLMESPESWQKIIIPADTSIFQEALEKCIAGDTVEVEYRILRASGEVIWIRDCFNPIKDGSGQVESISSILFDITNQKLISETLEKREEQFRSLLESSPNAIIICQQEEIVYSNPVAKSILGTAIDGELLINLIHPDSREYFRNHTEIEIKSQDSNFSVFRMVKSDGSEVIVKCTDINITFNDKPAIMIVGIDITKEVESERGITHLASHDYLTGLPNRNRLQVQLTNEITYAMEKKLNGAVLFIDLDRFKVINDSLSHSTGDSLLKEVGKRLKSLVLESDLLFRQGGDEFIIILSNAHSKKVSSFSDRIIDALSEPYIINGEEIYITTSLGISLFPKDGETADTIIKHAEIAMYEAKKAGNNHYKFFSGHDDDKELIDTLKIEMGLHKAIANNEFILQYQPKVNLNTGKVVGMEALIRWNHPEWGRVPPNTFIHIAEETGLIIPIGKWALYEACRQNKIWQKNGIETVISVNLSPKQFIQTNMVQTIAEVLHQTRLKPEFLEIEITESMTADIEYTISTLNELKFLGVKISIDDFGTGFSSLNYLKEFPVDTLKIDQSFVRELQKNPKDKTMVKTIISMAHNLNLTVVAEGIETKEQLLFLQKHLCNEGQGYLLSKPKDASEIEKVIVEIEHSVQNMLEEQTFYSI